MVLRVLLSVFDVLQTIVELFRKTLSFDFQRWMCGFAADLLVFEYIYLVDFRKETRVSALSLEVAFVESLPEVGKDAIYWPAW